MTGVWKFQIAKGRQRGGAFAPDLNSPAKQATTGFGQADFGDKGFVTIPVPANWEVEGFSRPIQISPMMPWAFIGANGNTGELRRSARAMAL